MPQQRKSAGGRRCWQPFLTQEDVLGHFELRDRTRLVADQTDTQRQSVARIADHGLPQPIDLDRSAGRLHDAEKDLHQCRFSRAVLAKQRMNLTGKQVEIHVCKDEQTPVGPADLAQSDKRARGRPIRGFSAAGDKATGIRVTRGSRRCVFAGLLRVATAMLKSCPS